MVAPLIALRFRDTTPGVDTIAAHSALLKSKGSVWWGWWKKDFENDHSALMSNAGEAIGVYMVDRSTSRMFYAESAARMIGSGDMPDLSLVPEYYHHSARAVYGWFLLTSLEAVDYEKHVGDAFGDGTLIVFDRHGPIGGTSDSRMLPCRSDRSSILVLSDLHFGPDYEFLLQSETPALGNEKQTLTACLLKDLRRIGLDKDIGGVIITGDFTSNGQWSDLTMTNITEELTALREALDVPKGALLALPGNHDVVRYPEGQDVDVAKIAVEKQVAFEHERNFRFFLSRLLDKDVKDPLDFVRYFELGVADLSVGVLNSCRILATEWTEYGFVGQSGIDIIQSLGTQKVSRPTFRLLAVHHHLLPVYSVEVPRKNGVTLSLDASKILEASHDAGIHIALHGHQHMPHLARYQSLPLMGGQQKQPIVVVSNGSSGVSAARRPGEERNTYCVLTFASDDVYLRMRELRSDTKRGNDLYSGKLGIAPALPE